MPSLSPTEQSTRPVVLIVEDQPDLAAACAEFLTLEGYTALVCGDGPSALSAAQRQAPVAAFLDVGLPGPMDGLALAVELRKRLGPRAKLFVMTGQGQDDLIVRSQNATVDAFLQKPVVLEQLALLLR